MNVVGMVGTLRFAHPTVPETVIASRRANARPMTGSAKQSISPCKERMDCFVASLLAMTSGHNSALSPHVSREVWPARSALFVRGRRECRAPDAPDSRVCDGRKQRAHALIRSHRHHPAFPAQWFYGLCRTLPGDRAFLSPSPLRSLLLKNLTPASRRQDHTILPSARKRSRL